MKNFNCFLEVKIEENVLRASESNRVSFTEENTYIYRLCVYVSFFDDDGRFMVVKTPSKSI